MKRTNSKSQLSTKRNPWSDYKCNEMLMSPFLIWSLLLGIEACPMLGKGTFCNVRALSARTILSATESCPDTSSHEKEEQGGNTTSSASSLSRVHTIDQDCERRQVSCYAIKKLKPELQGVTKISAAVDLAVEALFLSKLSHPNIVTFHGTGGTPGSSDFFIMISQIDRTLDFEIVKWRRKKSGMQKKSDLKLLFEHRLNVALQLVSGMKYLHDQR